MPPPKIIKINPEIPINLKLKPCKNVKSSIIVIKPKRLNPRKGVIVQSSLDIFSLLILLNHPLRNNYSY